MKILRTLSQFRSWRKKHKNVGFVPTMGAIHEGHLELVRQAQAKCDHVVVSIFVNPTQFNNPIDLKKYPRTLRSDLKFLRDAGVDALFLPNVKTLYPDDYNFKITEDKMSGVLCGAHRQGHFAGVLTVVMKLLNIVRPKKAFFGEKDFQQLKLIEDMTAAFFMNCKIVAVPTVREKSGLALSSRNKRLSLRDLKRAEIIPTLLNDKTLSATEVKKKLQEAAFKVDYVEDHWKRRFIAAHIGGVRLIDNVSLERA
jgi:pantoate--beta-alanine ligase